MVCFRLTAQDKTTVPAVKDTTKATFDKKEELIYGNNRYRKFNNYLTFGSGVLASTVQQNIQRSFGADYHFRAKDQYLVAGLMYSGLGLSSADDIEIHACYEIREEKRWTNVSLFMGPSLYMGVTGTAPDTAQSSTTTPPGAVPTRTTPPHFYGGLGAYFCFQAVFKIKYDLGFGFDVFADVGTKRQLGGLKLILFFSGSYRGVKKNYNPHVKSENNR